MKLYRTYRAAMSYGINPMTDADLPQGHILNRPHVRSILMARALNGQERDVVISLIRGTDPDSGTRVAHDDVLNELDVVRALSDLLSLPVHAQEPNEPLPSAAPLKATRRRTRIANPPPNYNKRWTKTMEGHLKTLIRQGKTLEEVSQAMCRSERGIMSHLRDFEPEWIEKIRENGSMLKVEKPTPINPESPALSV